MRRSGALYDALSHHSVGYLHEASDVSAAYIVDVAVSTLAVLHALLVDRVHDVVELLVYFLLTALLTDTSV